MLTFLEGKDIQQIRDRAILLVGFYGALRRSELAGIDVEDLKFTRLGLLITPRKIEDRPIRPRPDDRHPHKGYESLRRHGVKELG